MNTIPLETEEQQIFVEWLDLQGLKFTASAASTFTKSWSQKRKNYREGLRPGFSDLVVLISPSQSKDGEGYMLCIEMKRQKLGVQSDDQKGWERAINGLNTPHVQYYLAKGAEEAIRIASHYLKYTETNPF